MNILKIITILLIMIVAFVIGLFATKKNNFESTSLIISTLIAFVGILLLMLAVNGLITSNAEVKEEIAYDKENIHQLPDSDSFIKIISHDDSNTNYYQYAIKNEDGLKLKEIRDYNVSVNEENGNKPEIVFYRNEYESDTLNFLLNNIFVSESTNKVIINIPKRE